MWWQVLWLALVLSLLQKKSCASSLFPGAPPRPPIPPPRPPHPARYFDHALSHPSLTLHPHSSGGNALLDLYDGFDDPGEAWEEDDSWWDGVEEVILTNSFSDGFSYDELFYDDLYDINYTCTDTMECEEFASLPPPPDFILTLPPPPVPPFLQGAIGRLQEEGRKRKKLELQEEEEEEEEDHEEEESSWDQDQCSLCEWASGGNNTLSLLPPVSESGVGGGMIGVLVGVALVSAVVGAAVMVVLLRCRKFKILPSGRDTCPMLLRGTWTKGSATSATSEAPVGTAPPRVGGGPTKTGEEAPAAPAGCGTARTGWSMKLWRRGSSQERPLQPTSSQGSENSYTEEPYVNADAQSAVYAELNSTTASTPAGSGSGVVSYRPYSLNTYSEIPDPLRPLSLASGLRAYISESTYENAGYVLSEAGLEQPESSVGSTSTPSSAYYSDVSSSDHRNNNKKKKKRKNDERSHHVTPANISASVTMMNHHNILAGGRPNLSPAHRELGHALHNHEIFPLALEILPQHLVLDTRGLEAVLPPLQPNMNVIHTANQVQTLPSLKNAGETGIRAAVSSAPCSGGVPFVPCPGGVSSTPYPGGVPTSGTQGAVNGVRGVGIPPGTLICGSGVTAPHPGVPSGVTAPHPGVSSGVTAPHPGVPSGVTAPHPGVPSGVTAPHPGVPSGVTAPHPGVPSGVTAPHPGVPSGVTAPRPGVPSGVTAPHPGVPSGVTGGSPGIVTGIPGVASGVPGIVTGPAGMASGMPGVTGGVLGVIGGGPGVIGGGPGVTGGPGVIAGVPGVTGGPGVITGVPGVTGGPGVIAGVPGVAGGPGVISGTPGVTVPGFINNNNNIEEEGEEDDEEEEEEDDEEDQSNRPLPPLPSRQVKGPQRRGVYVGPPSKQDQPLPPVPSDYV